MRRAPFVSVLDWSASELFRGGPNLLIETQPVSKYTSCDATGFKSCGCDGTDPHPPTHAPTHPPTQHTNTHAHTHTPHTHKAASATHPAPPQMRRTLPNLRLRRNGPFGIASAIQEAASWTALASNAACEQNAQT